MGIERTVSKPQRGGTLLVACIEHMKAIVRIPLGQCMLHNVVIYQWESLYDCAS